MPNFLKNVLSGVPNFVPNFRTTGIKLAEFCCGKRFCARGTDVFDKILQVFVGKNSERKLAEFPVDGRRELAEFCQKNLPNLSEFASTKKSARNLAPLERPVGPTLATAASAGGLAACGWLAGWAAGWSAGWVAEWHAGWPGWLTGGRPQVRKSVCNYYQSGTRRVWKWGHTPWQSKAGKT